MRLIINCSSLNGGGGVQVALSLLEEFKSFQDIQFEVIYSNGINKQLKIKEFPDNFNFYYLNNSPSNIFKLFSTRKKLNSIEKKTNPDCVFTVFGPSYWRPKSPHLMGFALGHFIYPDSPFWQVVKRKEKIKFKILNLIKSWQIKCNADFFHIETEDAKLRLNTYYKIPLKNILVASNAYHKVFDDTFQEYKLPSKQTNEFRIVTISAYYSHKNLDIINQIVVELEKRKDINVSFILTLPENIFVKHFIKSNKIHNIGVVGIEQCPSIYKQCDAMFLPTLLEIFSASYIEAMKMGTPILTSDLSFAHDICGDAALFFNPLNVNDITKSIIKLAKDKSLQEDLRQKGRIRLKKFNSSKERAVRIVDFCKNINNKNVQK